MWIKCLFLALFLGPCALAPACAVGAADAMQAEAASALAQGRYEEAGTQAAGGLAQASLSELTRARLLVDMGLAWQAQGANEDALADFTQALSIAALPDLERARALFARGVSLDSLGRLTDAIGDYSGALKLAPGAPYALNNRANAYRRQGRTQEARRDYLAALAGANPNPQYPYYGLGQIAETEGDKDAARDYYNKALAADSGFHLAMERLQALGTPAEGAGGLLVENGVIVLRPPVARPAEMPAAAPAEALPVPKPVHPPPSPPVPVRALRPQASLRAAIIEGNAGLVQLGAWRSEAEARAGWTVAKDRAEGLLDGLSPVVIRVEIPGRGVFYRLRVRVIGAASPFCDMMARRNLSCIPAR